MGVVKRQIIWVRQKLQNRKGYTKPPELSLVLALFIFKFEVNQIPLYTRTYINVPAQGNEFVMNYVGDLYSQ